MKNEEEENIDHREEETKDHPDLPTPKENHLGMAKGNLETKKNSEAKKNLDPKRVLETTHREKVSKNNHIPKNSANHAEFLSLKKYVMYLIAYHKRQERH